MPDLKIDELIRSRRKTIALIVQPDGRLVVRAPLRATLAQIHALVGQKEAWIRAKQAEVRAAGHPNAAHHFQPGELFYFLGQAYPLAISPHPRTLLRLDTDCFVLADSARERGIQVFTRWYRQQAAALLPERAAWFADRYGFKYNRVRISAARTRWGSCSALGSLSFTWRLMLVPPAVLDYVVVHELAHTRERNHQRAFWEQVAAVLPDYQQRRKWLKANPWVMREL